MPFSSGNIPWNAGGQGRLWTDSEIEFLKIYYRALGATELAEKLGRSFGSVARKANKLGLEKGPIESPDDVMKVENLSETEAAYLAGLMDGEGTISMKGYRGQATAQATVYIAVGISDVTVIDWLLDKVGGYASSRVDGNPKHRRAYQWHTERAAHILAILLRIKQYVIVKKLHVEIAIEASKIRLSRPRKSRTTQDEIELMTKIRPLQMKRGRR